MKVQVDSDLSQKEGSTVVFEHDGPGGFGDEVAHVQGLSNVFQSTKSIGSVGFMGFGFKTIYKRFQKVSVSDVAGWTFSFHVGENQHSVGPNLRVFSRSWLGAVCPVWDHCVKKPSAPYTTRFEMTLPASTFASTPISKDIEDAFFQDGSCTVMAILASQGLREIKLSTPTFNETRCWTLVSKQHLVTVNERAWDTFSIEFEPSIDALQCLCQARLKNIIAAGGADAVWSRLSRKRHRIVGLVERNSETSLPVCPKQGGQLFATLPIQARIPLGMAIQAEWLLDLSRSGLRDLESNAWQRSIVDHIADVVAEFCSSIPTKYASSNASVAAAFRIISASDFGSGPGAVNIRDPSWMSLLRRKLEGVQFLPVISDGGISSPRFSVRALVNFLRA